MTFSLSQSLSHAKAGDKLTVLAIDANQAGISERLYALGIFPGTLLQVLRKAPLGDPLQVKAGHTLISIRRQEAEAVSVEALSIENNIATVSKNSVAG